MDIRNLLRSKRLEKNFTMRELADKIGVSEATISRWESGDIENMRRDKISALAKTLDISPSAIMGWEDDHSEKTTPTIVAASSLVDVSDLDDNELNELQLYIDLIRQKRNLKK